MGRIRLQVVITLVAVAVLVVVVGYLALSVTTDTVADYGGTYVEGVAGNPQYINPLLCHFNAVDQDLVGLLFSGLTRSNGRGEIVPDLAERWEVSPDGITYTFFLRQDVTWHDGAPFTADDVVYTISTIQDPEFPGIESLSDLWRTVVVERVDAYTVRFILREPYAPFLDHTTLGLLPFHILGGVSAQHLPEAKFNVEPVGTGPFSLVEISAQHAVLANYPGFYRERSYVDRIELLFYPEDAAVFEARRRGEIQGIARVLPQHLSMVRADEDLTLYNAPLSGHTAVYLNLDRGLFQDPAVRQAMMWALDRQGLVNAILGGQGIVLHSPVLPHSWAYDDDVTRYDYNPRRAISALEGHNWYDDDEDGVRERSGVRLEFTLVTNDDPVRTQLVTAIAEQLAYVGIRVTPQVVTWDELTALLPTRRYDAVLLGFQGLPPDPDPYPYWHSSQAMEQGFNFSNWSSAQADTLLQEARVTSDRERRRALYSEFQRLFAEQVPALLLYQPVHSYAVSSAIHGVQVGPMMTQADRFWSVDRWYMATQRVVDDGAPRSSAAK